MRHDPVITVSAFEEAREKSGEEWSDIDVFEEERDGAPLREVVLEVVEGQYTHPAGPDSVYGMEGSAEELVWDEVFSSGLVPEGVPTEVREKFARNFGSKVSQYASELYKSVRSEIDPESAESLSEVKEVLEEKAEQIVPETY